MATVYYRVSVAVGCYGVRTGLCASSSTRKLSKHQPWSSTVATVGNHKAHACKQWQLPLLAVSASD